MEEAPIQIRQEERTDTHFGQFHLVFKETAPGILAYLLAIEIAGNCPQERHIPRASLA